MSEKSNFNYPEVPPRGKARKLFDKRTTVLTAMVAVMFVVLVSLELRPPPSGGPVSTPEPSRPALTAGMSSRSWSPDLQRKYAQKLAEKGLKKEAADAFQEYLASASLTLKESANVLYTAGKLHFELGSYEAALAAFYQAEVAGVGPDLEPELNRKIVACLENLGRSFDAQSELEQRTALVKPKEEDETRAVVVGRIGNEEVTLGQLHDELQRMQQMNPQLAQSFRTDRRKLVEFLRQFIFEKLLARKARKLGLDQHPEFRKQIEEVMNKALAQTLIRQEVQSKVQMDPADVRNYFEANQSRYVEKAQAAASHILLKDEETATNVLSQAQEGKSFEELTKTHSVDVSTKSEGGRLKEPVGQGSLEIPGIGRVPEFAEAVFATKPGQVAKTVVRSPAGFHVIRVDSITPGRALTFEEAQRQVAYDYQMEKSQAALSRMIQETLEVERVQIYDQVILGQKDEAVTEPEK